MPRMTNTYMLGGDAEPTDIVADLKDGIYAVGFGGGIDRFDALEQVAHEPGSAGDDPAVEGDEPLATV